MHELFVALADNALSVFALPFVETTAGFCAKVPILHFPSQQKARFGAVIHVFEQVGADVVERVQSAQIGAGHGADEIPASSQTVTNHSVDGFRVGDAFIDDVERLAQQRQLHTVAHESQRFLFDFRRLFADACHQIEGRINHFRRSVFAGHHFD